MTKRLKKPELPVGLSEQANWNKVPLIQLLLLGACDSGVCDVLDSISCGDCIFSDIVDGRYTEEQEAKALMYVLDLGESDAKDSK